MKKIDKCKTVKTEIAADKVKIKVSYGFRYLQGNTRPYFSITGQTWERGRYGWKEATSGCIHEEIARYFPELSPLIEWHLVDDNGEPLHYVANALYWLENVHGVSKYPANFDDKNRSREIFEKHILFGHTMADSQAMLDYFYEALPDFLSKAEYRALLKIKAGSALRKRVKDLEANMRYTMERYGIEYIDPSEYIEDAA